MDDRLAALQRERDRLAARLARERSVRAQAEEIAERAILELHQSRLELQQRSAASLQERDARIRAILDSAVDAIITIDDQGRIDSLNPATEELFGYTADELLGENVSRLMPEPYRGEHDRYIRSYIETGEAKIIGIGREALAARKDGTTFPIDISIGEVRIGERRLFTGIVRDISERKAALAKLQAALVDLRRSRDDLLAVFNQLRVGTVVVDAEDRIAFLSESCGCLEGVDAKGAVGQRWDEVLPFDQRARDAFRAMVRQDPSRRSRVPMTWSGPSGREYFVEVDIQDDPRDAATRIAYLYDVSEVHALRSRLVGASHGQMIGDSSAMQQVYEQIAQVAAGDWTVLIEGETGTGKELAARAVHAASARKSGPFVAVNCAGLSESLLESQLFGHRRGAFTGAVADQEGLFEAAAGGTLFLDEIGDVSIKLQTALLRAIQEREILRVGDTRVRRVDVRIVAATNRDLQQAVGAGRFREDLLYRLRVGRLALPPLRERTADIPALVELFLAEQRVTAGKLVIGIDDAALQQLARYRWPGNVRELKGAVQFAVIRCAGARIALADLPPEVRSADGALGTATAVSTGVPPTSPEAAAEPATPQDERTRILEALDWAEGNRARAARRLGISRPTLYRRLRELGLPLKRPARDR